jgi:acyl CoA:acetate/3-ketoacid CoA transferase beta subunit
MVDYPNDITPEEFMVVCMAHQVRDGEIVAQGLATPLVAAAYLLARHTYAPNLYFASAIGQSVCREPAPLGLTDVERLWLDRSLTSIGFIRAVADVLPILHPKEFFRPGQLDARGNFNNIAFGQDYRKPRMRLPGSGGIPDVTTTSSEVYLYVPRHSRVTFVAKLDFLSGMGYHEERKHGHGPRYLVTDLGQFDYANEQMRLVSYHPGVKIEQIQAKTGFPLEISPDVHSTPIPTIEEIRLLREEIDPLGIRNLESLSGAARRELMLHIISIEKKQRVIH